MASDDSDGDISRTPPSPCSTTKQQSSPETLSQNTLSLDADNASDGSDSLIEQKDGRGRTYSYMSPISSDVDDIPETSKRRGCAKHIKRQGFKKTQSNNNISPARSEPKLEDCVLRLSQKKRDQTKTRAIASPKGSDNDSSKDDTGKARARKRLNKIQVSGYISTDSDSETLNKLTKNAPTSSSSNRKGRVFTLKVEQADHSLSDLDNSKAGSGSISEDEDAKGSRHQAKNSGTKFHRKSKHRHSDSASSDNEEGVEDKRFKVNRKQKNHLEQPAMSLSHKPRVKKKAGQGCCKADPIECEVCGRSMRCKAMLERHMLTHTGEKPFKCDECGKHYTSSSNLRIHQLSHSGNMDYACNECGQKFTHLPYLKRHLLRHSGKKLHICEHCGKGFIQKYHLLRHILIHTRQTPHVCDRCGMSFNRTDSLKLHLRNVHQVETNIPKRGPEKLYRCETCNKYFANQASLETHKRVHTGAKPYSCIVCSRQFKQSSHLYSHMNTHSSEKPHACTFCELKFTRKSYLRKHKERVHSEARVAQSN